MEEVPVRFWEADNDKALELALIENIQRSDLNPIEEAYGYKRLKMCIRDRDREGIALVRTRREEWMSGRAECLALPLRLQASPRYREGMAPPLVLPLVPSAAYVMRFLGS